MNSWRRFVGLILVGCVLLAGAGGCERKPCEVLVINGAPSLGMAQRYEVMLVEVSDNQVS